jgi:hypothetical protein
MRSYSPPIEYFHLGRVDKSERLFGAKRRLTFSSRNLRSNHTSSRSFDQSSFSSSSTFHSPNLDSVQIKERNLLPLRCSDDKGQNNPFQRRRRQIFMAMFYLHRLQTKSDNAQAETTFGFSDSKMVGAYLPESVNEDGFYQFSAETSKTPALRAGALNRYRVSFPPHWKEIPVSNARSGNYCQPRCDEATTEVVFSDPNQGTLQIIIIPTTKLLISKKFPSMTDVGSISNVLEAISPAITGSVAVEEEEIVDKVEFVQDGKVYYQYELLTPFAETGLHNIAKITTSQNYVIMSSISASESQWSSCEKDLRRVLSSFHVESD